MKLQSVPAPKFALFQQVSIQPAEPFTAHGELFESPQPERGVIVGMSYTSESEAAFFGSVAGWDYFVDGDFEMTPDEAATATERWEPAYFQEHQLTLIGDVVAVEILAA